MTESHDTYWSEFEAYLERAGHTIELQRLRQHPRMRLSPAADTLTTSEAPHFALAVTRQRSDVHPAGVRVQLVIEKKHLSHYYPALLAHRDRIEGRIHGAEWPSRDASATRHIRLWKPGNLAEPELWIEDFAWFAGTLLLFRRELGPLVVEAWRARP